MKINLHNYKHGSRIRLFIDTIKRNEKQLTTQTKGEFKPLSISFNLPIIGDDANKGLFVAENTITQVDCIVLAVQSTDLSTDNKEFKLLVTDLTRLENLVSKNKKEQDDINKSFYGVHQANEIKFFKIEKKLITLNQETERLTKQDTVIWNNLKTLFANDETHDLDIETIKQTQQQHENKFTQQSVEIQSISNDVATNEANIKTNKANVTTNRTDINKLLQDVTTNTTNISDNATKINSNTTNITNNRTDINKLLQDVNTNKTNAEFLANTITTLSNNTNSRFNDVHKAINTLSNSNIPTNNALQQQIHSLRQFVETRLQQITQMSELAYQKSNQANDLAYRNAQSIEEIRQMLGM